MLVAVPPYGMKLLVQQVTVIHLIQQTMVGAVAVTVTMYFKCLHKSSLLKMTPAKTPLLQVATLVAILKTARQMGLCCEHLWCFTQTNKGPV